MAIILLIVGLFFLLQLFVPSSGTPTTSAADAVVASVVVAFLVDTMVGFVFFILVRPARARCRRSVGLEIWKKSDRPKP
ncbi:MAG: hypothetical protein U1D30_03825 [Planctomycetota bacterium]